VWLHVGYVGAVAATAGLIQLFAIEASRPLALVLIISGSLLAAACWRRARGVLEHAERAPAVAPSGSARGASASRMERGTVIALSRFPRQANRKRKHDNERRRATPE
jgi:hypothetical protein